MPLIYRTFAFLLLCSSFDCCAELVTLTIGPGEFPDPSSVSVFVDAGLLGDDEVTSSISGDLVVDLLPSAADPTSVQIVEFNAQVDDAIDFSVGGGFLLPSVTVNADPGEIQVRLVEPGIAGPIEFGQFDQLENLVGFEGVVETSVQAEPFDLGEQDPTLVDFEAIDFTIDGENITLGAALVTEVAIPIEAGFLTLDVIVGIDGEVFATGLLPNAPSPSIPGDTDDNGIVDFADFLALSAAFGGPGDLTQGDFDGDGQVGFPDFLILSDNFGTSAAISVVPEPTAIQSALWISLALLPLLRRKRLSN